MHINGSNLMIFIEVDGKSKSIACATNHTLDVNMETISTSCKDSTGRFDTSEPGLTSWSMSTENLCSDCSKGATESDLVDIMLSRLPVKVVFGLEGDSANFLAGKIDAPAAGYSPKATGGVQYSGMAYITAFQKQAQNGQIATFSATFTGTGPIEKAGAIAALPTKAAKA